jgi:hypothetical protein
MTAVRFRHCSEVQAEPEHDALFAQWCERRWPAELNDWSGNKRFNIYRKPNDSNGLLRPAPHSSHVRPGYGEMWGHGGGGPKSDLIRRNLLADSRRKDAS